MSLLPDKPSDLIEVALGDLKKVEALPTLYLVDMTTWHEPMSDGRCAVCLAGATLAQTLGADPSRGLDGSEFGDDVYGKTDALNMFRMGDIVGGLEYMGITLPESLAGEMPVARYDNDRQQFHADMQEMVRELRRVGL